MRTISLVNFVTYLLSTSTASQLHLTFIATNIGARRNCRLRRTQQQHHGHALRCSALAGVHYMTVPELKEQLKKYKLPVSGRKQDLIERINEFHSGSEISTIDADDHGNKSDKELESLTVNKLKERLKLLGLPVTGLKRELIDRLKKHTYIISTSESDVLDATTGSDANTRRTDASYFDEDDDDSSILMDSNQESHSSEVVKSRRARRKKHFKTQEVRELIRANDHRAPVKAEEMISTLELIAKEENNDDYLPGPKQYTALIDAYAKTNTRSAEAVIERIMKSDLHLTTTMMNAILGAYVNMGTLEGAKEATAILRRMEYTRNFGGGAIKPNVYSYSLAIAAWAKCKSLDAAMNAEQILIGLIESYKQVSMNHSDMTGAEELRPNSVVFNSVIDAWANSGSPISGEKAEELLGKMEDYSKIDDHLDVRPDTITFNTCIKAWCNSNDVNAPQKAEELLKKLETNPEYPKRNGTLVVRPNLLSYNTVINSWAKSKELDSAARAEALLTRMLRRYKTEAFSTVRPDVVTFSCVLNALAKSKIAHKAEKCYAILESMIHLYDEDGSFDAKPNVICFNTILNACAFSASSGDDEKKQALSVAVKTLKILREEQYARPDAVSYGMFLKCCANLMPFGNARKSMSESIFATCCKEGLVGGIVLDEIKRCIQSTDFLSLLARCGYKRKGSVMSVNLGHLPPKWTENVKRSDMSARQRSASVKPKRQYKKNDISKRSISQSPVRKNPSFLIEPSWASGKDL